MRVGAHLSAPMHCVEVVLDVPQIADVNRALRDAGWVCAHLSEPVALEQF